MRKAIFLGTGASVGVPIVGCRCPVCTSSCVYDKRLRSSLVLSLHGKKFLIDVGPDFRHQALRFSLDHLDAVLITHAHADHIGGIDDLRPYYFITKEKLPCYASCEAMQELKKRFYYLFPDTMRTSSSQPAQLEFHPIEGHCGSVTIQGVPFSYCSYTHSGMKVLGFRTNGFAYVCDIKEYTDEVIEALSGVEVLVVSALRIEESPFHFTVDEAIAFSRRLGAKRTYLTHLCHEVSHEKVQAMLPEGIAIAYDGLEITW